MNVGPARRRYVVDASSAVRAYLRDEPERTQALRLLDDLAEGDTVLYAPSLFRYEFVNTVLVASRRSRISVAEAEAVVNSMLRAGIAFVDDPQVAVQALQLSIAHGCSAYDASYLALAQLLGCDVYTGDRALHDQVRRRLRWVRWIGDYS